MVASLNTPNMTERTRLKQSSRGALWMWLGFCAAHCALLALAVLSPVLSATPLEGFGMTALAIPYVLHQLGLPMLRNGGVSGWGLALPNAWGWLASALVWAVFYGGVTALIQRIVRR